MQHWQVSERVFVATSAVREASNREDFLVLAEEKAGQPIEILSGQREGELSYLGAKAGLGLKANPVLVDVGGGSTEISYQSRRMRSVSVPVGAVRAWEADWDETEIKVLLKAELPANLGSKSSPLVLVGGTATSLVAIKKGLTIYDPAEVQGEELTLSEIIALYEQLDHLTVEERRLLPGLQPERADIIVKGSLIIKCLLELMGKEKAIVSDSDLLDGLIWELRESRM